MRNRFHVEGILEMMITDDTDALREYSCVTVVEPVPKTCTRLQLRCGDNTSLITVYARIPETYLGKHLKYEEWHQYHHNRESLEQRVSADEHSCIYASLQLECPNGPVLRSQYSFPRRAAQRIIARIHKLFW
ncbi:hypothetical protein GF342_03650 [Candidatus Woesearchaeota archaeon]|nr:hypothetical protein [Candidatus Woesearchaeota archaeon]